MSNKNEPNSLQLSLSGQHDAAPENSVNNENCKQICRDFIWGLCNKGSQCKYRHELDFEAMKKTLKFCHDYQNPSGCKREHCTYLHTSKEEESLFFATGTLPHVLAERHANITVSTAETIPQIALFIQESLVGGPPPPPPSASGAPSSSPLNPRPVTMPLQQLPPPPPPPPPPNTKSATTIQPNPLFKVPPPPPAAAFSITQPPPPLPVFDASRPPPPILGMIQPKNTSQKRQALNDTSAGPSKLRKTEEPKVEDALCDVCVQREIRIENYRQDMEKISTEDEYQTLLYKKKLMEYQKQRDILRKLMNSDYKFVQELAEDVPQFSFREPLGDLNPSFLSGMSPTAPKNNNQQFLLQFMEYMFANTRSFESSSVRVQESLRTLSTTPRRSSYQSPDILQTLKDILGHASSERSVSSDLTVESAQRPVTNGGSCYRPYSNGQRVETRAPPPPAPLPPPPAPLAPPAPPALPPTVTYPHYPPPTLTAPRPPPTRAPMPPCPPYSLERYPSSSAPSPYYHYNYQ